MVNKDLRKVTNNLYGVMGPLPFLFHYKSLILLVIDDSKKRYNPKANLRLDDPSQANTLLVTLIHRMTSLK